MRPQNASSRSSKAEPALTKELENHGGQILKTRALSPVARSSLLRTSVSIMLAGLILLVEAAHASDNAACFYGTWKTTASVVIGLEPSPCSRCIHIYR
jgi:hypothetical protein